MIRVYITVQDVCIERCLRRTAVKAARAAAKYEGNAGSVSLMFTDNTGIHSLNKIYRKHDAPTDVLSFPSDEAGFLGDIAISLPRAQTQADEYGHGLQREVAFLIVHGMLHLFGYDHNTETEETAMRARQREILRIAGFIRT